MCSCAAWWLVIHQCVILKLRRRQSLIRRKRVQFLSRRIKVFNLTFFFIFVYLKKNCCFYLKVKSDFIFSWITSQREGFTVQFQICRLCLHQMIEGSPSDHNLRNHFTWCGWAAREGGGGCSRERIVSTAVLTVSDWHWREETKQNTTRLSFCFVLMMFVSPLQRKNSSVFQSQYWSI